MLPPSVSLKIKVTTACKYPLPFHSKTASLILPEIKMVYENQSKVHFSSDVNDVYAVILEVGQVLRRSDTLMVFWNLGRADTDKHCTAPPDLALAPALFDACPRMRTISPMFLVPTYFSSSYISKHNMKYEGIWSSKSQVSANRKPTSFRRFNQEHT